MRVGCEALFRSTRNGTAPQFEPLAAGWVRYRNTLFEAGSRLCYRLGSRARVSISRGDLTECEADALVNAANRFLTGSTNGNHWLFAGKINVDTAVHAKGGAHLLRACKALPVLEGEGGARCLPGSAMLTRPARGVFGQLRSPRIVHAVAPLYSSFAASAPLLQSAVASALMLAARDGARTVALPALGCGVNGFPPEEAAHVTLDAVDAALSCDVGETEPQAEPEAPTSGLEAVELVMRTPGCWAAFADEAERRFRRK